MLYKDATKRGGRTLPCLIAHDAHVPEDPNSGTCFHKGVMCVDLVWIHSRREVKFDLCDYCLKAFFQLRILTGNFILIW